MTELTWRRRPVPCGAVGVEPQRDEGGAAAGGGPSGLVGVVLVGGVAVVVEVALGEGSWMITLAQSVTLPAPAWSVP
ncbi:hypothetical protein ACFQ3T_05250 [Saccharothrix hoggarensis]|uniref:Uncharacterized protein n=1 Tax=Saccharothrix hoggarensis TaxID=913853 RepID=A0ABW3QN22_9PSEU